ncbi:MAG TPA: TonB-dependent receptor [Candidatus Acidoferrum sp.]|nr:TonB-dependent receptor [Candidatus Acidoferrum sp.]
MKRLVLAILVVLSFTAAANAQTFRGAINGTVSDPSGALVPNAAVKATENATGIDHNTVTTSDGAFAFQDIPLGFYKVTVTASGFPVYAVDKVEVTAGTIYTLAVKLTLQQQATTVEVSAAALTLDTTTQTQNMTITSEAVADMPLNGRDFTQLIAVAPGYGGYSVGGFGSLNGTRANQMNWQIDGVDNNDFWHNIPAVNQGGVSGIAGIVLPIDSIDEFSAQTQSNAEAGRNAGGTVNLVIKSGGNQIHGTAYYFNRNEFYGAHSPFWVPATGKKAPPLRNENYGFSVGGPLIKSKMFYFTSYEKQQYIIGLSGLATEPSTAWQSLALDVLANPVCAPVTATCTTRKYGSYAPVTPSSLSNTLLSTLWPSSVLTDPVVVAKGANAGNFFSSSPSTGYSYNGVAKIDYNISDKHRLFVRWFGGQGSQTAPTGGSPALGTASSNLKYYFEVAPLHVDNGSAVLNSTFTSKLTNQVLFGANYFNQLFHDFNNSFDTKALGLFLSPDATTHGQPIHGSPNIAIGDFEQIGITPPEGRSDFTWHLTDIASYVTGNHQFRFGGEFRQGHVNEFYHRHGTGSFTFDGTQGPWNTPAGCNVQPPATPPPGCSALTPGQLADAEALADFLAGDVASSAITVGNIERWVTVNAYNFFGSDSWQVTKKLNLNLGLRYEYFGPLHSDKKDLAVYVFGTGLKIQGNGINNIFPPDRNNFAPRLGFAYQPTAKNDLVVRGGVGVFYDQINMNPFLDFRPGGSRADGLEINPIGPSPASSYGRNAYNWQTVQTGGASVFPGVLACADATCSNASGLSAYSVSQNFRAPYFFNYNFQVEKSFGTFAEWQVGYVGSQGRKLTMMFDMPTTGTNFGSIIQLQSVGTSNYNALQTTFKLHSWHGLTSQYSFTWGHTLDEMSEYRGVISDGLNRKLDYGNSDFDTRRLFTANFVYDVPKAPWAHGWAAKAVNGWQVSSLWNFHTGQPSDELLSGLYLVGNPYSAPHKFSAAAGGEQWWNPSAFAVAGPGTPSLARNTLRGPGYGSVDLSVFKNIPITERVKIQLRMETFNLLNRINLASGPGSVSASCGTSVVGATCTNSGFGFVSDTIGDFNGAPGIGPGEAFNMQLAAKIIF